MEKKSRQKKPKMPNGTYWDERLGRYVEPSDAEWDEQKFKEIAKEK
jgi:hypothetical protein